MTGCIDIGNTRIKVVLFNQSDEIVVDYSTNNAIEVRKLFERQRVQTACISSVNTPVLKKLLFHLRKTDLTTHIFSSFSEFNFPVIYTSPEKIGLDRLFGISGALSNCHSAIPDTILTIDSGTATTLNFFHKRIGFTGGYILPGLHLMIHSLHTGTAHLPAPEFTLKSYSQGNSTEECITSAAVLSTCALIEKSYEQEVQEGSVEVYITGGSAPILMHNLKIPFHHRPHLIPEGMYHSFKLLREKEG